MLEKSLLTQTQWRSVVINNSEFATFDMSPFISGEKVEQNRIQSLGRFFRNEVTAGNSGCL
jgi:hypothetical protein